MVTFKYPWVLFLLPLVIVFIFLLSKTARAPSFRFSSSQLIKGLNPTLRLRLRGLLKYLRAVVLILIILALARPQAPSRGAIIKQEGIDIVLAIDCSTSMLAEDFKIQTQQVSRLDVTKMVVREFVSKRQGDRIGVVSFGTHAYTACPLTVDYGWAKQMLGRLDIGITEDSTSIGYAISMALNRLRESSVKSRIIILLTDGRNNSGDIAPQTAAEMAKTLGIKIYTIGVGTKGKAPYPYRDSLGVKRYKNIEIDLDEDTLMLIAGKTDGKYFRAADTESLKDIYMEINNLEKTDIEGKKFSEYDELFGRYLLWALALLLIEIVLDNTALKRIP